MKKELFFYLFAAMMICGCSSDLPKECSIPKDTVEFAGNAFSSFSLGSDLRLYADQNPNNGSEWTLRAVVPVRKEVSDPIENLTIDLIPLDDHGVRVRDGLVLQGEDLPTLLPVFNGGDHVERTIAFSIQDQAKKYQTVKDVSQLLEKTKSVRMDFHVMSPEPTAAEAEKPAGSVLPEAKAPEAKAPETKAPETKKPKTSAPTEYPMTLDGLCRKYGIYGMLSQYDQALKNRNKSRAKKIEDQLWTIEKRVKADRSIPESLRNRFVRYIEDKEDDIEDRY